MSEAKVIGANVEAVAKKDSQGEAADSGQEQDRSAAQFSPYRVVSIKKEDWEAGRADDTWYKYVVDNGQSTITGHRPGSRKQVEEHAEQFVVNLNVRSRSFNSVYSLRRGRPAKK